MNEMQKRGPVTESDTAGAIPTPRAFRLMRADCLEVVEPDFLVDGLFEADTLAEVFGDPGSGKSFAALDLAASVATGTDFHGRAVKAGPAIYLAGEGYNGIKRRLAAWQTARAVSLTGAPLFLSKRSAHLLDAKAAQEVLNAVAQIARKYGTPRLIVVDTVSRALAGGDENSSMDMSRFVAVLEDLRDRYPGVTVLLVHHTGHGDKGRGRGSTVLKAALDAEFLFKKSSDTITIECTKTRDAEPPAPLHFKLETVEIGTARDGSPITSAALIETDASATPKRCLAPSVRHALEAFEEAKRIAGNGDDPAAEVSVEGWREVFNRRSTADSQDTKKKTFQRARKALVEAGVLEVTDDRYRLALAPETCR